MRSVIFIENIDATVIAQRPKLRDYIDTMRENIAKKTLNIEVRQGKCKGNIRGGNLALR